MNTSFKAISSGVASATVLALAGFVGSVEANEVSIPGSACTATGTKTPKLQVAENGAVYNKDTASLKVTCPLAAQPGYNTYVYLNYVKRNTQNMQCVFHRRSFDGLSGATNSQSTTFNGSNYLFFGTYTSDYFNSVTCTLPAATGTSTSTQNGIIGTYLFQF